MPEHILDTGPLVGWINRRDQWHEWSVAAMEALQPPLITCEAIIAEAAWHLRDNREAVDQLFGLIESGALRIVEILPDHVPHLRALSAKYAQMDFSDAAVVRLSEIYPRAIVLTTDTKHFSVYRRFRTKRVAMVHP
ncbi:MAG: PIN domain-containing protein [Verrucomicrobiota bacterium]|nr:PIN domain-containing protein [Chthoniobacterales bacterium]MDQ3414073.1 PIN domain-containing protein [Verrucomicrobiota bacterium]